MTKRGVKKGGMKGGTWSCRSSSIQHCGTISALAVANCPALTACACVFMRIYKRGERGNRTMYKKYGKFCTLFPPSMMGCGVVEG